MNEFLDLIRETKRSDPVVSFVVFKAAIAALPDEVPADGDAEIIIATINAMLFHLSTPLRKYTPEELYPEGPTVKLDVFALISRLMPKIKRRI